VKRETKSDLIRVVDSVDEKVDSSLSRSDRSHCVVNTTGSETTLSDFETTTFSEEDVVDWNAYVVEFDLSVTVRSIVVSKDRQHTVNSNTFGVGWYENHGLLPVHVVAIWIGFTHDNIDSTSWITCS